MPPAFMLCAFLELRRKASRAKDRGYTGTRGRRLALSAATGLQPAVRYEARRQEGERRHAVYVCVCVKTICVPPR